MTRLVWVTLLALSGWLFAEPARQHARRDAGPLASIAALDAPERPAVPRLHEALDLLRQLALRGDERRGPQHARQLGASFSLAAAARAAGARRAARAAAVAASDAPRAPSALAFPYDATAPPPGRRA